VADPLITRVSSGVSPNRAATCSASRPDRYSRVRSGFSGGGQREAARANSGGGAVVHHVFHEAGDEIGDPRVENVFGLRVGFFEDFAVGADDVLDELGFGARAAVGERGVGGGDIDRSHFVGAEGDQVALLFVGGERAAHAPRGLHVRRRNDLLHHPGE